MHRNLPFIFVRLSRQNKLNTCRHPSKWVFWGIFGQGLSDYQIARRGFQRRSHTTTSATWWNRIGTSSSPRYLSSSTCFGTSWVCTPFTPLAIYWNIEYLQLSKRIIFYWKNIENNCNFHNSIPGQTFVLHSIVSDIEPTQSLPRPDGAGLVHVLDLDFCPVPHILVQLEYSSHALHFPFTKELLKRIFYSIAYHIQCSNIDLSIVKSNCQTTWYNLKILCHETLYINFVIISCCWSWCTPSNSIDGSIYSVVPFSIVNNNLILLYYRHLI